MIQSYDSPGTELFKKLLIHEAVYVYISSEIPRFEAHTKKKSFGMTQGIFCLTYIFVLEQQQQKTIPILVFIYATIFHSGHCCCRMLKQLMLKKQKVHNILTHKKP